jgi:hypothetical protein
MKTRLPCTSKAADLLKFFKKIPDPVTLDKKVDVDYFKQAGYSATSSASLVDILNRMGFIDANQQPTALWSEYTSSENRDGVLAAALKKTYAELFRKMMCPYLADDESILEYMRASVDATPREMMDCLETFRALSSIADFQDILEDDEGIEPLKDVQVPPQWAPPQLESGQPEQELTWPFAPRAAGSPVNLHIHIDPHTPDEKIETIFKYMRKYLLGKE